MLLTTLKEQHLEINSEMHLVEARKIAREFAKIIGFNIVNLTKIVTAVSELVRNVLLYTRGGILHISEIERANKRGIMIIVEDEGPGIPDLALAMADGYSTSGGLGKGLSGTKKLMDEFNIQSTIDKGTEVKIVKWVR